MYDAKLHIWQIGQYQRWWQRPFWKCDISVLYRDGVCVCSCSPKQPKVPGSLNFDSRHNLGPLKTWRSPIFEFFIFTDSRVFFRVILKLGFFVVFFVFFRKFQPFYQLGLWNFDKRTSLLPKICTKIFTEKFSFLGHFSCVFSHTQIFEKLQKHTKNVQKIRIFRKIFVCSFLVSKYFFCQNVLVLCF